MTKSTVEKKNGVRRLMVKFIYRYAPFPHVFQSLTTLVVKWLTCCFECSILRIRAPVGTKKNIAKLSSVPSTLNRQHQEERVNTG